MMRKYITLDLDYMTASDVDKKIREGLAILSEKAGKPVQLVSVISHVHPRFMMITIIAE